MKKLILCDRPKTDTPIYLDEINEKSIIGFCNSCDDKFFLTITKEYFVAIGSNNFITDSKQRLTTFDDVLSFVKNKEKVFVFNTPKELFKWLTS